MNYLFIIDDLGPGGAQRQMVELALALNQRGHIITFLVYHKSDFYVQRLKSASINVVLIFESNYVKRLFKMRHFIRSGKFDAVLSFLTAANFIAEISGFPCRKWRLIVGERSANPVILRSFKSFFFRLFHLMADYVVANSYSNLKIVRKVNPLLPERKCKVIYNIIDFEKWKPSDKYVFKESGKYRFIITASHLYLKNLDGLIEAVNMLNNDHKKLFDIQWYGDRIHEPYYDNSFPEALDKIKTYSLDEIFHFHEAIPDIESEVADSDAVLLLSIYEGLPNAVCEGMACGKPVICTKVSDNPDLLRHQGDLLCDPDPYSIRDAITSLLEMDKARIWEIGKENRLVAQENFERQKIVDSYLNLLIS